MKYSNKYPLGFMNLLLHTQIYDLFFEGMGGGNVFSAFLINSKFSNSKKSIELEGKVNFVDIFDQMNKFGRDEENSTLI